MVNSSWLSLLSSLRGDRRATARKYSVLVWRLCFPSRLSQWSQPLKKGDFFPFFKCLVPIGTGLDSASSQEHFLKLLS